MSQQRRADLKSIISAGAISPAITADEPRPEDIIDEIKVVPVPPIDEKPKAGRPKSASTLKERAKQVSVYFEPAVHDQLRELAFVERKKIHALVLEGVDLLFKKRGLPPLSQALKIGKRK